MPSQIGLLFVATRPKTKEEKQGCQVVTLRCTKMLLQQMLHSFPEYITLRRFRDVI